MQQLLARLGLPSAAHLRPGDPLPVSQCCLLLGGTSAAAALQYRHSSIVEKVQKYSWLPAATSPL